MYCLLLLISIVHQIYASPLPDGHLIKLSPEHYHPIKSLYHSQDKIGQYVYGYSTPTIFRSETKGSDGITHGGYSYIDAEGKLQSVQYTADALHGFQVAASNLPVESPEVIHARVNHLAEYEAIKLERAKAAAAATAASIVPYFNPVPVAQANVPKLILNAEVPQAVTELPEVMKARAEHLAILQAAYRSAQAAHLGYGLPQPVQDLPEVVKARNEHLLAVEQEKQRQIQLRAEVPLSPIPEDLNGHVVPLKTNLKESDPLPIPHQAQVAYTAQDYSYGPYSYGYVEPFSSKSETQTADGVVRGGYSYIDAFGVVQTVNYIADKGGFRVVATNIPVDKNHLTAAATATSLKTVGAIVSENDKKVVVPALYVSNIKY